jgi:hypothetical protein
VADHRDRPDRWRHDLKNQLGIILGFSELLLQDLDPADQRYADIAEIRAAAMRSMAIVESRDAQDPGQP